MTNKQQNKAIAKLCGWRQEFIHGNGIDSEVWIHPNGIDCKQDEWFPSYSTDLNACYEMEKSLKGNDDIKYVNELFYCVGINRLYYMGAEPLAFPADRQMKVINATAAQRAKAFLRTFGKWKE